MASAVSETPGSETNLSQEDDKNDFHIWGSARVENRNKINRPGTIDLDEGIASAVNETDEIEKGKTFTMTADLVRMREKKTNAGNPGDPEASYMRPRSFSDASLSKASKIRHKKLDTKEAVLKWRRERGIKFKNSSEDDHNRQASRASETNTNPVSEHNFEEKQSAEIILCRESKVVNDPDRGRKTRQDKYQDLKSSNKSYHALSRSKSVHGRTNNIKSLEDEDDIPPPKPALPEKYRTSYFMQQIQSLKPDKPATGIEKKLDELEKHLFRTDLYSAEEDLSMTDDKINDLTTQHNSANKQKADKTETKFRENSRQHILSKSQSVDEGCNDNDVRIGGLDRKSVITGRGRKPFRSESKIALFRSYDSKLRAIALQRELDTLRSSEHVRQRLSSSEQGDIIDLKRELDSINKAKSETKHLEPATVDTTVNSDSGSFKSSSVRSKTTGIRNIAQNTLSYKPNVCRENTGAKTLLEESKTDKHGRRAFPLSGAHKRENSYGDVELLDKRFETLQSVSETSNGVKGQDRTSLQRRDSRSKSETCLVRKTLDTGAIQKTVQNEFALSQTKDNLNASRGSNLSKSVSNINRRNENASLYRSVTHLKRKQDTIRKFNYDSLAQVHEKIRTNYERLPDRQDSESPLYTPTSEQDDDQQVTGEGWDSGASVGDNRSDEEKYAALSRSKILHSKSSSLDSHLEPNVKHHQRQKVVRPVVKLASSASLTDYRSSPIDTTLLLDSSSSSCESFDVYLNENKGVKREKFNTDIPPLPKKTLAPKNIGIQSQHGKDSLQVVEEKPLQQKVVLRQCRIGSDVAFSLVGLNRTQVNKPNGNGFLDGQGLVTLRMIPDEQGRFGFNVKGGADQGMPIIVSRVAPNTPADNCIPRLNEGDQVLFINGRDVSQHTHEQVVMFIRASRETHSGELILKIRPNAYSGEDNMDEPDLVYDPDTHQISSASGANALEVSLKVLEESLESGAALAQFEQLYRKKPGMTMNAARLENNIPKNRYRDISPYDQTRVLLKNGTSGDYINANYVNMEIPVSGIVNRYIAAQGPLPVTCTDFWQMVWEQQTTLVVMLTTKVERGRIKCHQYWPDNYETSDFGTLQITCVKEEESASFAFREFNLTNVETNEERHISHMQYIAWPDHGVPDDPADFLEFVVKVRQKRVGIVEPVIVHCSAGIGRTGVLITMETAIGLIEANQPVYPLSIVRQMRDQRAMLIQTPSQYKFVCEAIIRSYNEGVAKALPEYQR